LLIGMFKVLFASAAFIFSVSLSAQVQSQVQSQVQKQVPAPSQQVAPSKNVQLSQRFTFKTESKSFEKTKFKKLSDANKAVEKYRRSFAGKIELLEKRCKDRYGEGYRYGGVSLKQRAIGYMNEDLPVNGFSWKRLIVEAYLQCLKVP